MPNTLVGISRKFMLLGAFIGFCLGTETGLSQSAAGTAQAPQASGLPRIGSSGNGPAADFVQAVPPAITGISDESVRYRMFFRFMAAMDEFADKLEKEGKPEAAKAWRTHAQRAAGLGEQEGALLKEIASNCNLALANKDTELKTTIESALGQKADFISLRDAANPQLDRLSAERKEISDAHLDRMKAALGEESFRKLDAYVKDVFKSSTVVPVNNQSPGANASPSGSNTAAPPAKSSPPARSVAPMQPPSASKSTQRPEGVQ